MDGQYLLVLGVSSVHFVPCGCLENKLSSDTLFTHYLIWPLTVFNSGHWYLTGDYCNFSKNHEHFHHNVISVMSQSMYYMFEKILWWKWHFKQFWTSVILFVLFIFFINILNWFYLYIFHFQFLMICCVFLSCFLNVYMVLIKCFYGFSFSFV